MKGPNRQYLESLHGRVIEAELRGEQIVRGTVDEIDGRTAWIGGKPYWIPYITNIRKIPSQ